MKTGESLEFLELQMAVTGRYSLIRELGRGGMGIVFLARDVALERPVAIKLLPPHQAQDPVRRERFLREARIAAQLMHPHIVPIHTVEEHAHLAFFVMAFVDGETLTQKVVGTGLLSAADTLRLMREVAWALGYAHARGVIHRDIKPDNILLERESGRALVADFGIASTQAHETLSAAGALIGTVQYMSPEQAQAETLDGRSDVYSLAATAYFALTGASPNEADSVPAMLMKLVSETPLPIALRRPDIAPAIASIIDRGLAKAATDRQASADLLATELQAADRLAPLVHPELRAFLREVTASKVLFFFALLSSVAGPLLWGSATGSAKWGGIMIGISLVFWLLIISAIAGGLLQLRRQHIGWTDLDAALTEEIQDHARVISTSRSDEATQRRSARSFGWMGVLSGPVFCAAAIVQWRRGSAFFSPWFIAAVLAMTLFSVFNLRYANAAAPLPRWMRWFHQRGSWSIDATMLQLLRQFVRTPWFTRWYAGGMDDRGSGNGLSNVPTATLVLQRVDELVQRLPDPTRRRLADVLPAISGLEQANAQLRAHVERIEQELVKLPVAHEARAALLEAKQQAVGRLAESMAVLDGVRTDLLRLHAGLVEADGITEELDRARDLSRAISAELAGVDVVRALTAKS